MTLAVSTLLGAGAGCSRQQRAAQAPFAPWTAELDAEGGAQASVRVEAISVGPDGRTVAIGPFKGLLRLAAWSIRSEADADGFVAMFARNGALQWLTRIAAIVPSSRSLAFDGASVFIAAPGNLKRIAGAAAGASYSLTRLDAANGRIVWQVRDEEAAMEVAAASRARNVYVAGLSGAAAIRQWRADGGDLLPPDLQAGILSAQDVHVACYGDDGHLRWRRTIADLPFGRPVASDLVELSSGDVAVAGIFASKLQIEGQSLRAENGRESFVALFSPEGVLRWVKRLPGEIRRFLPPRLAATRSGVVVLHSAHLEGEPAAPERDYRVVAFDASGAILSTRAVDLDSRNGFYTQLASGRDDRLFVAGEDLGEGRGGQPLVLEIVPAGKTGLTGRRALAGDVAPIGLGVGSDGRFLVTATAKPHDATMSRYSSRLEAFSTRPEDSH